MKKMIFIMLVTLSFVSSAAETQERPSLEVQRCFHEVLLDAFARPSDPSEEVSGTQIDLLTQIANDRDSLLYKAIIFYCKNK